jgi:hypothetical protein
MFFTFQIEHRLNYLNIVYGISSSIFTCNMNLKFDLLIYHEKEFCSYNIQVIAPIMRTTMSFYDNCIHFKKKE